MREITIATNLFNWLSGRDRGMAQGKADLQEGEFWIDPNIINQRVAIEGLGEIQITPQGSFLLNSAQFLKLSRYETDKGLPHAASKSLEDGSFLVSFPVSKPDTV